MRYFRNIVFALAAFMWLPASAHCQLETIPGLEFLRCAADNQNSQDPCGGGGCCSVEKSHYKAEQNHLTVSAPDAQPALHPASAVAEKSPPVEVCNGNLTAAPPQLVKTWHFVSRTALPVRAPSLAS